MNLFRAYTYTWWQMGVFKVSLLAIGMILGAFMASVVLAWLWVFVVVAVILTIYVVVMSLTGANKR
jgi:hypothetical protein